MWHVLVSQGGHHADPAWHTLRITSFSKLIGRDSLEADKHHSRAYSMVINVVYARLPASSTESYNPRFVHLRGGSHSIYLVNYFG